MINAQRLRPGRLLVVVLLAACCTAVFGEQPVVFVNVNVIPMDSDRLLTDQAVVVDGERIIALGPSAHVAIPDDSRRIDARGHYLMPGLYELHAHVPTTAANTERVLSLFLANGVTTIRGMLGAPGHLPLREQLARGERSGPRLITSGPSFNGRSVSGPDQAREMVRAQHEAGYDFLKLHPGLTRAEFDAIADEANKLDIPFAGHVSADVGVHRALAAGQDSIDHLDGYMQALVRDGATPDPSRAGFFGLALAPLVDDARIDEVATLTAEAGVWNVATQTLIENFASPVSGDDLAAQDHMRYMPADTVATWRARKNRFLADDDYDEGVARRAVEVRRNLLKALHEAGAGLLLGSDAPQVFNVPGFASHEELALLVAAGLTPYEALRTGTANPAVYFNEDDRYGTIAEGHVADLVLLKKNPLKDIRNVTAIAGVMAGGRWYPDEELAGILRRFDERP